MPGLYSGRGSRTRPPPVPCLRHGHLYFGRGSGGRPSLQGAAKDRTRPPSVLPSRLASDCARRADPGGGMFPAGRQGGNSTRVTGACVYLSDQVREQSVSNRRFHGAAGSAGAAPGPARAERRYRRRPPVHRQDPALYRTGNRGRLHQYSRVWQILGAEPLCRSAVGRGGASCARPAGGAPGCRSEAARGMGDGRRRGGGRSADGHSDARSGAGRSSWQSGA